MEEKQNNPLFSEQEQPPKDAHQAQKNGANTGQPDTGSTPVRPTHASGSEQGSNLMPDAPMPSSSGDSDAKTTVIPTAGQITLPHRPNHTGADEKTTMVDAVKSAGDGNKNANNQKKQDADRARRKKNAETTKKVVDVGGHVILRMLSYVFNVLLTLLLIGLITGSIIVLVFALYVKAYINPTLDVDLLTSNQSQTTMLYYYDDNGVAVEMEDQRLYGSENRLWVSYDQIPKHLCDAFIAIEDKRFESHHGVDWITTLKATFGFLTNTDSAGGSTITQQLIKNLTGDDEVRIQRKVQEIFRALNLEKQYSKEQILEMYLNTVSLSQGTYGVQAASYKYFNKDVSQLTLEECAALASIVQYPSKYDPVQNPENNTERRRVVLTAMRDQHKITESEYMEAYYKELNLDLQDDASTGNSTNNSWYTDAVIEDVLNDLQETYGISRVVASRMIYSEGLSIYTCMDRDLQTTLEQIYLNDDNFPSVNSVETLQSASVIVDHSDGSVVALVGGRGEKTQSRMYNLATQAHRSPGSSIKPIAVYAPALDRGLITYGSAYDDSPLSFNGSDPYPSNLPAGYGGLTYIDDAIARSVNTVAMRVLLDMGAQEGYDFAKNKAGLAGLTDHYVKQDGTVLTDVGPSLALGGLTVGVTVREMAGAYTMFANEGIYQEPRTYSRVLDKEGNVLLDNSPHGEVAISAQSASIMTEMLKDVVENGTGRAITLRNTMDVAAKTGTTSSDYDRWCVGYTPYYTCAVWIGFEQPKAINTYSSQSSAMFDTIMTAAHQKILAKVNNGEETLKQFNLASGVVTATFCRDSGDLLTDACRADLRGSRAATGYFTTTTVPTNACERHVLVDYDMTTGAVACEWCPNKTKVGLLNIQRSFEQQVYVTDAQYAYWPQWKPSMGVTSSATQPCFASIIPAGTYVGYSGNGRAANSFCYEHYQGHENE